MWRPPRIWASFQFAEVAVEVEEEVVEVVVAGAGPPG